MIQIVLDTNVLVAGLRSKRGASFALLESIETGNWKANISVALALEYEAVLKRKGMVPAFDSGQIDKFLKYLFSRSNLPVSVGLMRPALRDPKDDLILEVAIECDAAIVTHNVSDFVWSSGHYPEGIAWQIEEPVVKIQIEIPDDIYREAEAAASHRGLSVEELFGSIAESHLRSWKALNAKAAQGKLDEFREILRNVPDVEPEEYDRL